MLFSSFLVGKEALSLLSSLSILQGSLAPCHQPGYAPSPCFPPSVTGQDSWDSTEEPPGRPLPHSETKPAGLWRWRGSCMLG